MSKTQLPTIEENMLRRNKSLLTNDIKATLSQLQQRQDELSLLEQQLFSLDIKKIKEIKVSLELIFESVAKANNLKRLERLEKELNDNIETAQRILDACDPLNQKLRQHQYRCRQLLHCLSIVRKRKPSPVNKSLLKMAPRIKALNETSFNADRQAHSDTDQYWQELSEKTAAIELRLAEMLFFASPSKKLEQLFPGCAKRAKYFSAFNKASKHLLKPIEQAYEQIDQACKHEISKHGIDGDKARQLRISRAHQEEQLGDIEDKIIAGRKALFNVPRENLNRRYLESWVGKIKQATSTFSESPAAQNYQASQEALSCTSQEDFGKQLDEILAKARKARETLEQLHTYLKDRYQENDRKRSAIKELLSTLKTKEQEIQSNVNATLEAPEVTQKLWKQKIIRQVLQYTDLSVALTQDQLAMLKQGRNCLHTLMKQVFWQQQSNTAKFLSKIESIHNALANKYPVAKRQIENERNGNNVGLNALAGFPSPAPVRRARLP